MITLNKIKTITLIITSLLLTGFAARKPVVKEAPPVVAAPIVDSFYPCEYDVFWWAVCMAESGCSNTSVYKEPAPLNYESIGLYQLSPEDHRGYPECSPNRADYFIAEKNTECKNAIEKKLRSKNPTGNWSQVLGAYWSVLRNKNEPKWDAWRARNPNHKGYDNFVKHAKQMGCVF